MNSHIKWIGGPRLERETIMRFVFTVEIELERSEGKFATREELAEQLRDAIESANPDSVDGENGGSYDVQDWSVEEETVKPAPRKRAPAPVALPAPVAPDSRTTRFD